jgi:SpoVK/Ycf46/Vps4 family AAA+-type ATPase
MKEMATVSLWKDFIGEASLWLIANDHKELRIGWPSSSFVPRSVSLPVSSSHLHLYDTEIQDFIQEDFVPFLTKKESLSSLGFDKRRSYLLAGPPGTGKTHIIKEMIRRLPNTISAFTVNHEAISCIHQLSWTTNQHNMPAFIVIEDIDLLLDKPQETQMLLNFLDGINSPSDMIVVMTTNDMNALTDAIVKRPGRVDRIVQVLPGQLETRTNQVRHLMSNLPCPMSAEDIAKETPGFSIAQYRELIRRTLIYSTNDTLDAIAKTILECNKEFTKCTPPTNSLTH